jgi:hypothetical protein
MYLISKLQQVLNEFFSKSPLDKIPEQGIMTPKAFMKSFNVYNVSYEETGTLQNFKLLELFHSPLHSWKDYLRLLLEIFHRYPGIAKYLEKFVILEAMDKPGFTALKKMLAQYESLSATHKIPNFFLNQVPIRFRDPSILA